ncbi:hypothetical protein H6P81_007388 [Aristolochia fimbriata]|uniref:J domain-containing protein n=1 Tax=Aristolochia fimbriata TaxID=158543 RepID=A0AAV7F0Q1_ARIFI|nr:hypothetical protein H6P81_007388 [Aristolochia fimbriata]
MDGGGETKKDYYKVLEVDYDATEEAIKSSYRRLALKWHPDKHKGDSEVTAKFQEINEAYKVLSDPATRLDYDVLGNYEIDKYSLREYLSRFKGMILTCNGLGMNHSLCLKCVSVGQKGTNGCSAPNNYWKNGSITFYTWEQLANSGAKGLLLIIGRIAESIIRPLSPEPKTHKDELNLSQIALAELKSSFHRLLVVMTVFFFRKQRQKALFIKELNKQVPCFLYEHAIERQESSVSFSSHISNRKRDAWEDANGRSHDLGQYFLPNPCSQNSELSGEMQQLRTGEQGNLNESLGLELWVSKFLSAGVPAELQDFRPNRNDLLLRVGTEALLAVPLPELHGVAGVRVIGLGGQDSSVLGPDLEWEALVVAASGAFELVHPVERGGGDGVELAGDAVAGTGEVEEEGDAVGPADEGVAFDGAGDSEEDGVVGADHVLDEGVVGESALEGAVREDDGLVLAGGTH